VSSGADDGVAEYRVVFARSARRELEGIEATVARRIISRVEALTTDPRPHGCVKLQGAADLWRIRVGDYRVVPELGADSIREIVHGNYRIVDRLRPDLVEIATGSHGARSFRFD
jgi:mRNA interferase RelE/StbE